MTWSNSSKLTHSYFVLNCFTSVKNWANSKLENGKSSGLDGTLIHEFNVENFGEYVLEINDASITPVSSLPYH